MTLHDKFLALDAFLQRGQVVPGLVPLVQFLMASPALLARSSFVKDVSYAPNYLMIGEMDTETQYKLVLGQYRKTQAYLGQFERPITPEEAEAILVEGAMCNVPAHVCLTALSQHQGDLLIQLVFSAGLEPQWYESICEENPYLAEVMRHRRQADLKEIERQAAIASHYEAINRALETRDREAFRRHREAYLRLKEQSRWSQKENH